MITGLLLVKGALAAPASSLAALEWLKENK